MKKTKRSHLESCGIVHGEQHRNFFFKHMLCIASFFHFQHCEPSNALELSLHEVYKKRLKLESFEIFVIFG